MKTRKAKELIIAELEELQERFDLRGWQFGISWQEMDGERVASASMTWPYREATLSFDARALAHHGREAIRRTVLHEMLHVVCSGYQDFHTVEQLEAMVTHLGLIVERSGKE